MPGPSEVDGIVRSGLGGLSGRVSFRIFLPGFTPWLTVPFYKVIVRSIWPCFYSSIGLAVEEVSANVTRGLGTNVERYRKARSPIKSHLRISSVVSQSISIYLKLLEYSSCDRTYYCSWRAVSGLLKQPSSLRRAMLNTIRISETTSCLNQLIVVWSTLHYLV